MNILKDFKRFVDVTSSGRVVFFCALIREARYFIDKLNLKKDHNQIKFQIFSDAKKSYFLVISGIGNIQMAAAIGYAAAIGVVTPYSFLINVGSCGSKKHKIGHVFDLQKIKDYTSDDVIYALSRICDSINLAQITTVTKFDSNFYELDELLDMEAYAFFRSSLLFVPLENLKSLKIVTDNNENHVKDILRSKGDIIEKIMISALASIESEIDFFLKEVLSFSSKQAKIYYYPLEYHYLLKQNCNQNLSFSRKILLKEKIVRIKNDQLLNSEEIISKFIYNNR